MAKKSPPKTTHFIDQVELALKHWHDEAWLTANSPLATTYFLGEDLLSKVNQPSSGQVLAQLLDKALDELAQNDITLGRLLHLRYKEKLSEASLMTEFNYGAQYLYKLRHKAIDRLGQILSGLLKPALHLELPQTASSPLFRGTPTWQQAQDILKKTKSIGITGMSGVGKTTLAIELAETNPTFWYTFRLGVNDRLVDVLFALAHFLQEKRKGLGQVSALFQELNALDKQKLALPIVFVNLLAYDLEKLSEGQIDPIFCFDRVEVITTAMHAPLSELLEGLVGVTHCRLILIGETLSLFKKAHVEMLNLVGLPVKGVAALVAQTNLPLSPVECEKLHALTQGNPRLVGLFISLCQMGDSVSELLTYELKLDFLLSRLWHKIVKQKPLAQQLLAQLTVFRQPAPRDAWSAEAEQHLLDWLFEHHLIQINRYHGLTVWPEFQHMISEQLEAKTKQTAHEHATIIFMDRGLYTAAAYHLAESGKIAETIDLLYSHHEQEINQGQIAAVLAILQAIPREKLYDTARERHGELKAKLHKLLGEYDQAKEILQNTFWRNRLVKARIKRLEGDIAELAQGQFETARQHYEAGLKLVLELMTEKAVFHKNIAWTYLKEEDFEQARQQALQARFEAVYMQGSVELKYGMVREAEIYLQEALKLAEELQDKAGQAKVYSRLGWLYQKQRVFDKAIDYSEKSLALFQFINRPSQLADAKCDLATVYTQMGQPTLAIPLAEEALDLHSKLKESGGIAYDAHALSEAHLAEGNIEKANYYSMMVLDQEEGSLRAEALRVRGEIDSAKGDLEQAIKSLEEAKELAKDDDYTLGYCWRSLIKVYLHHQKNDNAIHAYNQTILIFEKANLPAEVDETKRLWQELTLKKVSHKPK